MIVIVQRIVCLCYISQSIIGFKIAILYYQSFKLNEKKKVKSYSAQYKIISEKPNQN